MTLIFVTCGPHNAGLWGSRVLLKVIIDLFLRVLVWLKSLPLDTMGWSVIVIAYSFAVNSFYKFLFYFKIMF